MPKCPEWLSDEAKKQWKFHAAELQRLGLLTVVDGAALAAFCEALATWREAQLVLNREGLVMEAPSGYAQQRPEVSIAAKARAEVKGFAAEFGLTPASRTKLAVPEPQEDDGAALGIR